jgi:hypothetical protein
MGSRLSKRSVPEKSAAEGVARGERHLVLVADTPALRPQPKTLSNVDATLDHDVSIALTEAIASASPTQKLTLLMLLETPGALSATEGLISAIQKSLR